VTSPPDFELIVGLRARELVARVPPAAQTDATGGAVSIEREERRGRLPPEMEPGAPYDGVIVEKRVVGEVRPAPE
jgi:hypothetical protein